MMAEYSFDDIDLEQCAKNAVTAKIITDQRERMAADTDKLVGELLLAGLLPSAGWEIEQTVSFDGNKLSYMVKARPPLLQLTYRGRK